MREQQKEILQILKDLVEFFELYDLPEIYLLAFKSPYITDLHDLKENYLLFNRVGGKEK